PDGEEFPGDRVPLGRPVDGRRIYIVDERGEPAPIDVRGEILIGGEGLARGYWNRPDLTAAAFIPDAFSGVAAAWLYRTGDYGRCREDGMIEFLGRKDGQVKIRGHRIELGEIEAALRELPPVSDALVIVRSSGDEAQLAAYIVKEPAASATGPE